MRPELRRELDALNTAREGLRSAVQNGMSKGASRTAGHPPKSWAAVVQASRPRDVLMAENFARAEQARVLFARHHEATALLLSTKVIRSLGHDLNPLDIGVVTGLRRTLGKDPNCGILKESFEAVVRVMSAIWPEGAPWPADIPRPETPDPKEDV